MSESNSSFISININYPSTELVKTYFEGANKSSSVVTAFIDFLTCMCKAYAEHLNTTNSVVVDLNSLSTKNTESINKLLPKFTALFNEYYCVNDSSSTNVETQENLTEDLKVESKEESKEESKDESKEESKEESESMTENLEMFSDEKSFTPIYNEDEINVVTTPTNTTTTQNSPFNFGELFKSLGEIKIDDVNNSHAMTGGFGDIMGMVNKMFNPNMNPNMNSNMNSTEKEEKKNPTNEETSEEMLNEETSENTMNNSLENFESVENLESVEIEESNDEE